MGSLAALALLHPRRILAVAGVFVVLCAATVPGVFDALFPAGFRDADSPSERTAETLRDAVGFETEPGLVVLATPRRQADLPEDPFTDPAAARQFRAAARLLFADRDIARVAGPAQDPRLRSRDGTSALLVAFFEERGEEFKVDAVKRLETRIEDDLSGPLDLRLGGYGPAFTAVNEQVKSDLARAELIAFPLLFLLLVVVFRGLVAASLPLLVGVISVLASIASLRLMNEFVPISVFSVNIVTGLGLGLAVDYSLFLVSRFREEIAAGEDTETALRTTMATAGRTVVFSAITVAAALLALVLFPQRFLYSMGLGGAFVSVFAAVAALTVVPALLALLGPKVDALRLGRGDADAVARRGRRWRLVAEGVSRRPGAVTAATLLALVLVTLPAFGMERTGVDERVLDETSDARIVAAAIDRDFAANLEAPVVLAIEAPAGRDDAVQQIAREVAALPGTLEVAPPQRLSADLVLLQATPRDGPLSEAGLAHTRAIRALDAPVAVGVTGQGAGLIDFRDSVDDHLPAVLLVAAGITLLVLFLLTGSVLLPVGAVIANLLTLGAAYGFLVVVFQDGNLEGPLGFTSLGAIDTATTMLIFGMVFGLSTDYAVFLLARIAELRRVGYGDRAAIVLATERTGSLITAAAILFCVAIGAMATSSLIFLKQTGLGTAVAVMVDATLVRVFLVPAVMHLLGRSAWWAPGPLGRLHARFGLRE
jgi:uncharacterized membrane protein YdfJ with MMPL/SSD domain